MVKIFIHILLGLGVIPTSEHGIAEKTASIIGAKHSTQMLKKSELLANSANYIKRCDRRTETGVVLQCTCCVNMLVQGAVAHKGGWRG